MRPRTASTDIVVTAKEEKRVRVSIMIFVNVLDSSRSGQGNGLVMNLWTEYG